MTLPTTDQVLRWVGLTVHDETGIEIGTCQNVYADDDTQVPEWIEVSLPDDGAAMVPILGATDSGDVLRLAHPADRVRQAPRFAADVQLEVDDERALYDHYGVAASTDRSDTLLPDAARLPGDGDAPETPAAPRQRLRRIEPVPATPPPVAATPPPPAPTPPPPAPTPPPAAFTPPPPALPTPERPDRRPLLGLLAVPAGLLLARWLRQRREPAPAEVGLDVARRVTPLVAPLAAGLAALVWQRRRTRAAAPLEVASPPQLAPAPAPDVAVVAVAETSVLSEVPESDIAVEEVAVVEEVILIEEVVDRDGHRPV